jgi:malate synthase
MSLKQFIESENRLRAYFKEAPLDADKLTQEDATRLFQRLDSNMSPEHLHADGERPAAQARALDKMYRQAFTDLKAKGFTAPVQLYNFA